MTKHFARLILAALCLSLVVGAVAVAQVAEGWDPMPEELSWSGHPFPIFVAASRVLDPATGQVDLSVMSQTTAHVISKTLSRPYSVVDGQSCIDSRNVHSGDSEPRKTTTLEGALDHWDNVLVGSVVGQIPGFRSTRPGTLFRVATEEVLRGTSVREVNYVFVPAGTFTVGGLVVCANNYTYAQLPSLGDRLLVTFDDGFYNDRSLLLNVAPSGIVTLRSDGSFSLPPLYRRYGLGFDARSVDELLGRSRERLRLRRSQR